MKNRFGTTTFDWQDKELLAIKKFLASALDIQQDKFNETEIKIIRKWYYKQNAPEKVIWIFENVLSNKSLSNSNKVIVLNRLLDKIIEQGTSVDEIIDNAKKLLQARFNLSPESEVVEKAERVLTATLNDLFRR